MCRRSRWTSRSTSSTLAALALAALAALAALGSASPAAAEEPGSLDAAAAELAVCSGAGESRSPAERAAAADRAESAFAAALPTAPLAARLGLARTLMECRIEAAPMMEKAQLTQRIEGHLQAALEIDPASRQAHFLYGLLLAHVPPFLGRGDDAVRHFETLLALAADAGEPAPVEAYLHLGDLTLRQGRPQEAREVWRRGLAAHPEVPELAERLREQGPEESRPAETGAEPAPEPRPSEPAPAAEDSLATLARRQAERAEVPGVAVAVGCGEDNLLLAGFGHADVENQVPMAADSVVRIGSVSKQLVAVVALRLAEDGVLALDAPVERWLPAALASAVAGITVHHLLTHTAGLPLAAATSADWLGDSLAAPRAAAPGERYAYSNLGYALLGRLLERAAGERLPDLLRRLAIEPAGLAATGPCDERAIVPRRARGYAWRGGRLVNADPVGDSPALLAAGGLCSTAADLLRWQRALHGGRLLAAGSFGRMTAPPAVADPAGTTYAAGLRVHAPRGRRVIHHSGATSGFLSEVAHYPGPELTVVVLANSDAAEPRELAFALAEAALGGARPRCSATLGG